MDEGANVEPPSKKDSQKGAFFKRWGPVFVAEGRFSTKQPVPKLGNDSSTKADVEEFYNFWYTFDSWRTFEYLDEEVPDDTESRDQKRHVERKNNNARKKRKNEDTARLRKLVDDALALDERIKKFRQQEHAQKNKKKFEKEEQAKKAAEDAAKKKEDDAKAAAEKAESDKLAKVDAKKAKEAAKNAAKKNKRVIRGAVKDANYFHVGGEAPAKQIDQVLNEVDLVIASLDPEGIAALTSDLNGKKSAADIKGVFSKQVAELVSAKKLKDSDAATLKA